MFLKYWNRGENVARKAKVGIDYFSHDVDMLSDRKIKLLKAKHGLIGYAVYLRLLEELYRDKGYYLEINDDFNILFSDDNNLDLNVYILILNDCINQELFNINLFKEYSILTSRRIQENYITACERRKGIDIYSEFMLIDIDNVNIKLENVNIIALNANISTQSKKKVNRKENENDDCGVNNDVIKNIHVYNYWQEHAPHKHKTLSKSIIDQLDKLSSVKADLVIQAIENYAKAFNDSSYYYSYVWTLDKFIKQSNGYAEWIEEGKMLVDYSKQSKTNNKNTNKSTLIGAKGTVGAVERLDPDRW